MLLCGILLVSLAVPVLAEDGSGSMGESAFWRYDSATQTITISGTGDVTVFSTDHSPWHDHYYGEVTRVIVEEGITGLYGEVFAYLPRLAEVSLPSTLKGMGGDTFLLSGNEVLDIVIPDSVTELGTAFHSSCIRSIRLGRGLTELAPGAFTESPLISAASPKSDRAPLPDARN